MAYTLSSTESRLSAQHVLHGLTPLSYRRAEFLTDRDWRSATIGPTLRRCVALFLVVLAASCQKSPPVPEGVRLSGVAEDLWGNRIDLATLDRGITLIEPFSPSNCGYCMLVGEFVALNYFRANSDRGGRNFHQCLFNPQLDIYAYQKYYRDSTAVLTSPVSLHAYHRDGFPAMLAFRDGRQILNGSLEDYQVTFRERAAQWWPEREPPAVTLPSGLKTAETMMYEPKTSYLVMVVPDGDSAAYADQVERSRGNPRVAVRYEGGLTAEDLQRDLAFVGRAGRFAFGCLDGEEAPIVFDGAVMRLGVYEFPRASTGLAAVVPNPHNREKYLLLRLTPDSGEGAPFMAWVDLAVWRHEAPKRDPLLLLEGRFAKDAGGRWYFSDSLAVAHVNLREFCAGGVCPVPRSMLGPEIHHHYEFTASPWMGAGEGRRLSLGTRNCRFPSVAGTPDGTAIVVWEENGDIVLARLGEDGPGPAILVEDGPADAYNPRIVWEGQSALVVYLCNQDGFYHLYGRYLDGDRLSQEFRLTGPASFDVVTPALASNGAGEVVVAWSEWQANFRRPWYRLISHRTVEAPKRIAVVPDGAGLDYVNAWGFSLACDRAGEPFGMWNQHYPATLCVCGGPLDGPSSTPQNLTGNVETSECGEYPATALDAEGSQWAVWGTYAFDLSRGEPQQILVSRRRSGTQIWSVPLVVSDSARTWQNQTPRLAVSSRGIVSAVWSGRTKDAEGTWGIYLARNAGQGWSPPILISEEGACARAPEIALGTDDRLWITWHSGVGREMVVKVWVGN